MRFASHPRDASSANIFSLDYSNILDFEAGFISNPRSIRASVCRRTAAGQVNLADIAIMHTAPYAGSVEDVRVTWGALALSPNRNFLPYRGSEKI